MAQTATRRSNGGAPADSGPARAKAKRPALPDGPPAAARRGAVAAAKRGPAGAAKRGPKGAKKTKKAGGKATDGVSTPSIPKPNFIVRKLAAKAIKKLASHALEASAEVLRAAARAAAEKAAATPAEAVQAVQKGTRRRLPIQRSLDVAAPLLVVWEEWLALESLPEGVDTVTDIERDGDVLVGRISGPRARDWEAEVLDEREEQSFAWLSHDGSDCSGLITFHELSSRLTRVELNLDVVPTGITDHVRLKTHLADRRAEAELRRFKARVELINPDEYEDEVEAWRRANESEPAPSRNHRESNHEEPQEPQDDTDELDEAA